MNPMRYAPHHRATNRQKANWNNWNILWKENDTTIADTISVPPRQSAVMYCYYFFVPYLPRNLWWMAASCWPSASNPWAFCFFHPASRRSWITNSANNSGSWFSLSVYTEKITKSVNLEKILSIYVWQCEYYKDTHATQHRWFTSITHYLTRCIQNYGVHMKPMRSPPIGGAMWSVPALNLKMSQDILSHQCDLASNRG